jgi:hypothetical protein
MSEDGGRFGATCPRCDAPIDGGEDACPECDLTFIDEEGGLSDDAIDAMMADVDLSMPEDGPVRGSFLPGWIRLFVGLAIALPLAPVVTLVAVAVTPLPTWAAVVVFTLAWLVSGYRLARYSVPTLIVATGLVATGVVLTGTPLFVAGGRALLGTDPGDVGALGTNVAAAGELFALVGVVVLAVGLLVRRHALATRARWRRQREDPEAFVDHHRSRTRDDERSG